MFTLPTGTVTFLLTDIEGSTRLWQEKPQAMAVSHPRHNELLRQAIEAHNGYVYQIIGDSFCAAFHNAFDGLCATLSAQQALHAEAWGESGELRVRMGLHSGAAEMTGDGSQSYSGGYTTLATTQRVMSAAHGGQVLLSQTIHDLLGEHLPESTSLRDMGEHRLKDLRIPMHLYQLIAPGLVQDFPAISSLTTIPNNLPLQLTSFIGREKEISDIKSMLKAARLVTLTGSGGTGKTRLAQEAAAELLASFPQGVWLIELASLTDPAQIIPAMAQTFGLQPIPFVPQSTQVVDYLRDKKALLILDNCEHLIEACAHLADDLLHQCASLKIIASSREPLGISGEVVYLTPPLVESESTQLFLERARMANPQLKLTESNEAAIAQICTRLDGIPLAIELAAARSRLLSPEQIASRLDDRFRLLVGGSRTALPRQQTLRALIDWSYDLLTHEEKKLLRIASVFIGGWTLEALEAISGDPQALEHLEQLIIKSLVIVNEQESVMRYGMLETIRQYAREKLYDEQEALAARDRHFYYYNELSENMWDAFRWADIIPLRDRVQDEGENFRAALEWGMERGTDEAVRLAANFYVISSGMTNPAERWELVRSAVENARALPPVSGDANIHRQKLIARALFALGMVGLSQGNLPQIEEILSEAIAISRMTGDRQILGYSLQIYFIACTFLHKPEAEAAALEGLHIFTQEVSDNYGLLMSYLNMTRLSVIKGDENQKQYYFERVKELVRNAPDTIQVGLAYLNLGMAESAHGNYTAARPIFEEGLGIFKRIHHTNFQLIMQSELGHIARHSGDLAQARLIYMETIKGWQNLGNRSAIAHQLECFAYLALAEEEAQRAIKLFATAEALREVIKSPMTDNEQIEYDQTIAKLRTMLAETEYEVTWSEGRSMTMESAIDFAVSSQKATSELGQD